LAAAAVEFARSRGARALEAYPIVGTVGKDVLWGEARVGTPGMFEAAGLRQVHQPSLRRLVMRVDFDRDGTAAVRATADTGAPADTGATADTQGGSA
jgi:hypothetical protein